MSLPAAGAATTRTIFANLATTVFEQHLQIISRAPDCECSRASHPRQVVPPLAHGLTKLRTGATAHAPGAISHTFPTQMPVLLTCCRHVSSASIRQQAISASARGQQSAQWQVAARCKPTATGPRTCTGGGKRPHPLVKSHLNLRTTLLPNSPGSGAAAAMAGTAAAGSGMQDSAAPELEQVPCLPTICLCNQRPGHRKPSPSPCCFHFNMMSHAAGPVCRGRLRRRSARPGCHGELPDVLNTHISASAG